MGGVSRTTKYEFDPPPMEPVVTGEEPTTTHFAFRLGLGVRYWAHPHIGLSLASGLGGDAMSTEDDGEFASKSSVGTLAFFGSLGAVGVF